MLVVCPSCETRYNLEGASFGPEGRRVRCTACGHSWLAKAPEEGDTAISESTGLSRAQVERLRQAAIANASAPEGPHAASRAREQIRRRQERRLAAGVAWAISIVVFSGIFVTALVFRNELAALWPRSASVFRLVGVEVNRYGLALEGVTAKRSFDGTTPVLTVRGALVNDTRRIREAPGIEVVLRDEADKTLLVWREALKVEAVASGRQVEFSTRIISPPPETFALTVTLAPPPDPASGPKQDAAGAQPALSPSAAGEEADNP